MTSVTEAIVGYEADAAEWAQKLNKCKSKSYIQQLFTGVQLRRRALISAEMRLREIRDFTQDEENSWHNLIQEMERLYDLIITRHPEAIRAIL